MLESTTQVLQPLICLSGTLLCCLFREGEIYARFSFNKNYMQIFLQCCDDICAENILKNKYINSRQSLNVGFTCWILQKRKNAIRKYYLILSRHDKKSPWDTKSPWWNKHLSRCKEIRSCSSEIVSHRGEIISYLTTVTFISPQQLTNISPWRNSYLTVVTYYLTAARWNHIILWLGWLWHPALP